MISPLRILKNKVFKPGVRPLAIRYGPLAGVKMNLDLGCETQNYLGLHERELHKWIRRFIPGIKTMIDVGAEAGIYTLHALMRTGVEKVYSFEPSIAVQEKMIENFSVNGLTIDDPRLNWSKNFVGNRNEPPFVTLTEAAGSSTGPVLVKIDVDGGEVEALQGATALLARKDVRWVIETHTPELEIGCLAILGDAGFTARVIKNAWWRLFIPEQRPIPHNRWIVAYHPGDVI